MRRFFVGWSGGGAAPVALAAAVVAPLLFCALGLALGAAGGDPAATMTGLLGAPRAAPEIPQAVTVEGVLERGPYPLLRTDPTPLRPQGETLLMSRFDKRGVPVPDDLYGWRVAVTGTVFRRGDLSMLITDGRFAALAVAEPQSTESLGRWRLTGEICDGKCYPGVMKPGDGLAHRACAALCFVGDVPAVFVTVAPAVGARFFVLADADGGPPPVEARRLFGVPVQIEGALERRGGALVFRADFETARLL